MKTSVVLLLRYILMRIIGGQEIDLEGVMELYTIVEDLHNSV